MEFLKTYKIRLTAQSPVFIGSGQVIGKKEYVFDRMNKIVKIPDLPKMFGGLQNRGKLREYEKYMLESRDDLYRWFTRSGIPSTQYQKWMKYEIASGDAVLEDRSKKEIQLFIKDPFGLPYIPGSSLKGAIRTAILTDDLLKNKENRLRRRKEIEGARKENRMKYLRREAGIMEENTFMTLERNEKRPFDPINDWMAAIRISDSRPIELKHLVLCQKIDMNIQGELKPMPLLRECLKPGTEIEFDLTIDTSLSMITEERIMEAIKSNYGLQYDVFVKSFKGRKADTPYGIYIGGGSGFVSKTNVYPIFGQPKGVEMVSKIIDQTLPSKQREQHKHYKDKELGVSPHIIKMTKYNGKLYEMGLSNIKIDKI